MFRNITIIGDVHGKLERYKNIIEAENARGNSTVAIGDFGFKKEYDWFEANIEDYDKNKILMGNHDYYPNVKKEYSLGHFHYDEELEIFYVRGAWSIDHAKRILGVSLFKEEELNYRQSCEAMELYLKKKPYTVISHDCPRICYHEMFNINDSKSSTSNLLQSMWDEHKPNLWIFGHHHQDKREQINKTEFICLPELKTYRM